LLWQPDCGKTWKRPQSNKLIAETDNDKHWQCYLYELDSYRPLALVYGNAQQDNIKLYRYQNDHLGTPIALTGSLGDTLYECQYNAYGQIINETYHQDDIDSLPDNPLRFQGQYYDEETGLHYNLNRYYDLFTGRYITQDPLGILGGLNSYQYAGSDPINWIDLLGLIKVENNGFEAIAEKEAAGTAQAGNKVLNYVDEPSFNPAGIGGAAQPWSIKGRLKHVQLPTEGKIRFIPAETYSPTNPLPRGPNNGYIDKFGNEWVKGPSRTYGQAFEWDVQLSPKGRA
jgi:RHS repeat-associated protein